MASLSLWLDEPYRPRPPPSGKVEADVAIVGAGMAGASMAWALAGQGLRVALLEASQVAARASGRNAGFVISSLAESYADLVATRGRDDARTIQRTQEQNRERVAELVAKLGIACGFERTGSYCAAADQAEAAQLRRSEALLRQDGFEFRFVEPAESREVLGLPGVHGALFRPGDGHIHPARFVRGLVAAAEQRGVQAFEGAEVRGLRREPPGWALQGEGWEVRAPRVVIAANILAPRLHPWFAPRLRGVRGQVLATAPIPGLRVPAPVYADHGYLYWKAWEGRLVLGGQRPVALDEEVGVEETVNPSVQAALDRFLAANFPGVKAQVTHRWAGIMDFSADGFPFVGPVPGEPGLLTAVGFTGHGFGYATVAADWLGALLLKGRDEVPGVFRTERTVDPTHAPR